MPQSSLLGFSSPLPMMPSIHIQHHLDDVLKAIRQCLSSQRDPVVIKIANAEGEQELCVFKLRFDDEGVPSYCEQKTIGAVEDDADALTQKQRPISRAQSLCHVWSFTGLCCCCRGRCDPMLYPRLSLIVVVIVVVIVRSVEGQRQSNVGNHSRRFGNHRALLCCRLAHTLTLFPSTCLSTCTCLFSRLVSW